MHHYTAYAEWCQTPLARIRYGKRALLRYLVRMERSRLGAGWVPTDASFGARLALLRQRMGWGNTKEAALACGLPVQSWRGWERDNRMPRDYIGTCQKIADATGVDVWWLAGLDRRDEGPVPTELPRKDSNLQPFGYPALEVAS